MTPLKVFCDATKDLSSRLSDSTGCLATPLEALFTAVGLCDSTGGFTPVRQHWELCGSPEGFTTGRPHWELCGSTEGFVVAPALATVGKASFTALRQH